MAGHTLSAYADEQTYRQVSQLARLEDRSTAQIVSAALRLYMRLPRAAHDALRQLEAAGPAAAETAGWAVGRALLDQQYEAAVAQGLAEGGARTTPAPAATEDQLLARAVEISRRPD